MKTYSHRQYVELFHLLLLDQLGRKLDKRFYILKGGCNLRFFLKSIRYSEDMDIDILDIPPHKLQDTLRSIMKSKPFEHILQVHGIRVECWSEPKQTETTQRWKMGLMVQGASVPLPTKIEFSRRGAKGDPVFEPINTELIATYQLGPVMSNHYHRDSAYQQKAEALLNRSVTQARDIFDMNMLLSVGAKAHLTNEKVKQRVQEAQANAISVSFDVFKSQVLSFLHPDYQAQYDSESVWENVILNVVEALGQEAQ